MKSVVEGYEQIKETDSDPVKIAFIQKALFFSRAGKNMIIKKNYTKFVDSYWGPNSQAVFERFKNVNTKGDYKKATRGNWDGIMNGIASAIGIVTNDSPTTKTISVDTSAKVVSESLEFDEKDISSSNILQKISATTDWSKDSNKIKKAFNTINTAGLNVTTSMVDVIKDKIVVTTKDDREITITRNALGDNLVIKKGEKGTKFNKNTDFSKSVLFPTENKEVKKIYKKVIENTVKVKVNDTDITLDNFDAQDEETKQAVIRELPPLKLTFEQAKSFLTKGMESRDEKTKQAVIYELLELNFTFEKAKSFLQSYNLIGNWDDIKEWDKYKYMKQFKDSSGNKVKWIEVFNWLNQQSTSQKKKKEK